MLILIREQPLMSIQQDHQARESFLMDRAFLLDPQITFAEPLLHVILVVHLPLP